MQVPPWLRLSPFWIVVTSQEKLNEIVSMPLIPRKSNWLVSSTVSESPSILSNLMFLKLPANEFWRKVRRVKRFWQSFFSRIRDASTPSVNWNAPAGKSL
jgi:hypothetical protein